MIDPAGIFTVAEAAFKTAGRRRGAEERRYRVAGRVLALQFVGPTLAAKLSPALAHLEPAGGAPADLVIGCWDDTSAGVSLDGVAPGPGRRGLDYFDGAVRIAWDLETGCLQACDIARRVALYRVPDASSLATWEQGAPFRHILHWWAAGSGLQFVHGAALGTTSGGVLLVGRGGSGKSTTALACIGSSLGYLADDYCLLEPGTPPRVHSIYGSGKADAASIARLPRLADAFRSSLLDQQGKSIIFIGEHVPAAIVRSTALRAVIVPKIVSGAACCAEVLPRGEALRAIAPSTLFQLPGDRASSLARMSALIRDLPCLRLHVGEDPASSRPIIEGIIAGRGAPL